VKELKEEREWARQMDLNWLNLAINYEKGRKYMLKVKHQLQSEPRKIETPTVPLPMSSIADDSSVQET